VGISRLSLEERGTQVERGSTEDTGTQAGNSPPECNDQASQATPRVTPFQYPGSGAEKNVKKIDVQQTGMATMEIKAGEVVGWTEGRNLLLLAPICVMGIEVPEWWSRKEVERALELGKTDLLRWAVDGEQHQSGVLGMMDKVREWWQGVREDPTHSPMQTDESPRSPTPESPASSRDTSDSEDVVDISDSDSDRRAELEDLWEAVNKYDT
jgi:hypothetical protein